MTTARRRPAAFDLEGRTALVTGAGSATGIGFAAARMLGELGARVILTGTTVRVYDRAAELSGEGIDALGIVCTLDSEVGAVGLQAALAAGGLEPTILVNNAGMVAVGDAEMGHGDILTSPAEWDHGLAINLSTAFHATRTVIGFMRAAGWGRVITVSSVSGALMASRGDVAYAAAKAGLVGMTKSLGQEVASRGITVNCVAPGFIRTAMTEVLPDAQKDALNARIPMGRMGEGEDIGAAVAYLASKEAGYMTGQTLHVNGGMAMLG